MRTNTSRIPAFIRALLGLTCALCLTLSNTGCTSETEELIGLALNPPSRKSIPQSRTGVNNFFVNREFGTIPEQYLEIRDTLGLRYVRVLFAWTSAIQPTPTAEPDYSFYDEIVAAIPPGVDVLVTVVHTPEWITNPANWVNGNPRTTWVERWLRPTVARYANTPGIIGWQIWNEPDNTVIASDAALGLNDPALYFELLAQGSNVVRSTDPSALVLNAATRSIQQGGGENLGYNKDLIAFGAEQLVDVWAIHYYGKQFEQVIRSGGVADFLDSLSLSVWVTESGAMGPTSQRSYVETVWPYLDDKASGKIRRFYYYQFGETTPIEENFGLRMNGPDYFSDLYLLLSGQG